MGHWWPGSYNNHVCLYSYALASGSTFVSQEDVQNYQHAQYYKPQTTNIYVVLVVQVVCEIVGFGGLGIYGCVKFDHSHLQEIQ